MSMAGATANRRRHAEREFALHVREVAERVFRPMLREQIQRAQAAEERAAILQTAVEHIATGVPLAGRKTGKAIANTVLEQLGITPDLTGEA